jgi:hypothetical protein
LEVDEQPSKGKRRTGQTYRFRSPRTLSVQKYTGLQSSIVQDKCALLVECVCELGAVIAKAELAQFWTAALR